VGLVLKVKVPRMGIIAVVAMSARVQTNLRISQETSQIETVFSIEHRIKFPYRTAINALREPIKMASLWIWATGTMGRPPIMESATISGQVPDYVLKTARDGSPDTASPGRRSA